MKALAIATSVLGMAGLTAAEIRWTAKGTVSSVSGASFIGTGVVEGNTAEVTLTYDSNTPVEGRSFLPIGSYLAGRAWFTGNANLGITVKIGANVWTGEMPNIPKETNVMESVCWDLGGNEDWFNVTLDAARGGTFPSFPQSGSETARSLMVEFRDELIPAELFDIHVLPNSVSNVCAMTSAKGSIKAGSSTIAFTIDPKSVHVTQPQVPVSISKTGTGIRLTWDSALGKVYRIEGSSNLRCWSPEGIYTGTGESRQQDFTPFGTYPSRFYRIVEL